MRTNNIAAVAAQYRRKAERDGGKRRGADALGYEAGALVFPACAVDAAHRRDRCAIMGHAKHHGLYAAEIPGGVKEAGRNHQEGQDAAGKSAGAGLRGDGEIVADTKSERCGKKREHITRSEEWVTGCSSMADTDGRTMRNDCENKRKTIGKIDKTGNASIDCGRAYSNSFINGLEKQGIKGQQKQPRISASNLCGWDAEPRLGGVADGVPAWMDRYWIEEPDIPRVTTKKEHRVDRLRALGNAVYWRQFYPIFRGIMEIETWSTYSV